jgi:hypothetical protein
MHPMQRVVGILASPSPLRDGSSKSYRWALTP